VGRLPWYENGKVRRCDGVRPLRGAYFCMPHASREAPSTTRRPETATEIPGPPRSPSCYGHFKPSSRRKRGDEWRGPRWGLKNGPETEMQAHRGRQSRRWRGGGSITPCQPAVQGPRAHSGLCRRLPRRYCLPRRAFWVSHQWSEEVTVLYSGSGEENGDTLGRRLTGRVVDPLYVTGEVVCEQPHQVPR